MQDERAFLRHTLATLAYRGGKATRGAQSDFGEFKISPATRTPLAILCHIGDLLEWALTIVRGEPGFEARTPQSWEGEVQRFHRVLQELDAFLAGTEPMHDSAEKVFQGPIADAFTHVGQIALLRGVHGEPVRGENYYVADIETGRVGAAQPPPKREFG
jgi:hypothetical protein